MRHSTRFLAAALAAALAVARAPAACERAPKPVPRDTARVTAPESTPVAVPPPPASTWDARAGPALFVRGGSPTAALVVFPQYADSTLPDSVHFDDSALRGATLELFSRAGAAGEARVRRITGTTWARDGCIEWPRAQVVPVPGSAPPASWTVAFVKGRLEPIPLDSIEALPRPDSALLAADVTRLASALPNDTAVAFRGIPFSVRTARRFTAAPGVEALVADVVRKLNLEATPLEQHTLLIAERGGAEAQGRYRTAYFERRAGAEETIESTDVLAAVRLSGAQRVALVLVREGAEASAYALLERSAPGRWRVRWTSAHTGC